MRFGVIDRVILFGGAPLLVAAVEHLRLLGMEVFVYTSPRHAEESVGAASETLAGALTRLGQPFVVAADLEAETALPGLVTAGTLGLGLGEAWPFSQALIERFDGRLLDFMGIPHPRYRGGAHYTWMILRGDRRMGLNLQLVNARTVQGEYDDGAIVKSGQYELPATARTPQDYFDAAVPHEIAFLAEFLDEVRAGKDFLAAAPDEACSLLLPRLRTVTHGLIDWSWSGHDLERFICAFDDPYAGASTGLGGRIVHLKGARLLPDEGPFHPFQSGLVTRVYGGRIVIATRDGHLEVARVLEGGRDVEVHPGERFHTGAAALEAARVATARYGVSPVSATEAQAASPGRLVTVADRFHGDLVTLRLCTPDDCTERYVAWLADPEVNRYLETRHCPQPLSSIRRFVTGLLEDPVSYLFAICDREDGRHVGNLKIGPVSIHHSCADVSYFIGERDRWGRGLASDAIRVATRVGFSRLGLHRVQAGVYSGNQGSIRALLKAGYREEGRFREQLQGPSGREDHVWYGFLRSEWPRIEEL